jgi:hypothetical protein
MTNQIKKIWSQIWPPTEGEIRKWFWGAVIVVGSSVILWVESHYWTGIRQFIDENPSAIAFMALSLTVVALAFRSQYWRLKCSQATRGSADAGMDLAWKQRYEAVQNTAHTIVFRVKDEYGLEEGCHIVCPLCFHQDLRSLLVYANSTSQMRCLKCNTTHSVDQLPQANLPKVIKELTEKTRTIELLQHRLQTYEPNDLCEFEVNLIKELSLADEGILQGEWRIGHLLPTKRWEHHIDRLQKMGFLQVVTVAVDQSKFVLTIKGRDYAIAHQLI